MYYLGAAFGFWLFYALNATFAKHKGSLITMTIIGLLGGISSAAYGNSYALLIGTIIAVPLIASIVPLQINSSAKRKWKNQRKKK